MEFNADKPDPAMAKKLRRLCAGVLAREHIDSGDTNRIEEFASKQVTLYKSGENPGLNATLAVHVFRPHEFDFDSSNEESLKALMEWLPKQPFDWRHGSKTVHRAMEGSFLSAGSKRVKGGREYVDLDALVVIQNRRVAVEVEASGNLDNGYSTLRQAIRAKTADYGVMIVPWAALEQGRADEGKALGRLDREFEGSSQLSDGPIYRIAIVRQLDLFLLMQKGYSQDPCTDDGAAEPEAS